MSYDAINDERRGLIYFDRVKMDKAANNGEGTSAYLRHGMVALSRNKNLQTAGDRVFSVTTEALIAVSVCAAD